MFYFPKDLIFKLNRKVKFFERSDKMRCYSKSKAIYYGIERLVLPENWFYDSVPNHGKSQ